MIKIVVHSPKGGVGKTTLATNIAVWLARRGHTVWAWDLAQGQLMTDFLNATPEFAGRSKCAIKTEELGELPIRFRGGARFDFLVADTDDYFKIYHNLLERNRIGWRAVAPIVPGDQNGLIRIPHETAKLMLGALLLPDQRRPNLFVVMNRCPQSEWAQGFDEVSKAMERHGARKLLSDAWIPLADAKYHPIFVDQKEFSEAIDRLLLSIGVRSNVTT